LFKINSDENKNTDQDRFSVDVYLVDLYFACVSRVSVFACPFTSSPSRANHNLLIMTVNLHSTYSGSAMRDLRVWTQAWEGCRGVQWGTVEPKGGRTMCLSIS